jgi:hypothetical protein
VPSSFEKCVESTDLHRWSAEIQGNILDASAKLAELVAIKLAHTEMTDEVEEDMMHMLLALCGVFDKEAEFHKKHVHARLPRAVEREAAAAVEADGNDVVYAAPLFATPVKPKRSGGGTLRDNDDDADVDDDVIAIGDSDDDDADLEGKPVRHGGGGRKNRRRAAENAAPELVEAYRWLRYLINHFGVTGGFESVLGILHDPSRVSLKLLDATVKPIAKCVVALEDNLLQRFEENTQITLEYLAAIVEREDEQLTGPNPAARDRRYLYLTSALRSMQAVLGACVSAGEAEKRVSAVNRAVVEGMLGISTFNMQLVALREINAMLEHAGNSRLLGDETAAAAMKVAVRWLEDKRVLPHVLRPVYLHHKQYVDQVAAVLKTMLQEGAMSEEHLDLLWDITQKQDTFEEVKNNVLDLLAALAWHFSGDQLDSLFSRFERAGAGGMSLADSGKILEMVQKLAKSDSQGVMAERLLELLWRMIHAGEGAGSSAEMVTAFTQILGHYDRMSCAKKEDWMGRALGNVSDQSADLAISLHLMQSIVKLDSEAAGAAAGGGGLEGGAGAGAGAAGAGGGGGEEEDNRPYGGGKGKGLKKKRRGGESTAAAAARENAAVRREWLRRLDQSKSLVELLVLSLEHFQHNAWPHGATSPRPTPGSVTGYHDTLKALMEVILFVIKHGEIPVDPAMAQRLWVAFVEAPQDGRSAFSESADHPVGLYELNQVYP